MAFSNPYNFVDIDPNTPVPREPPVMHQAVGYELFSGRMICQVVALSPIFLPHPNQGRRVESLPNGKKHLHFDQFFDLGDGVPVIPGASLKGALRAVTEALANGCMSTYSQSYPLPENYKPCGDIRNLCPTCRLFGMTTPDQERNADEQLFFKGKVTIGDARWSPDSSASSEGGKAKYLAEMMLPILSLPKPRHDRFYKRGNFARGRKFYYHHGRLNFGKVVKSDQNRSVTPLAPGTVFTFEVSYHHLTQAEFALLVFALELDSQVLRAVDGKLLADGGKLSYRKDNEGKTRVGCYHKLGYGKPAGLGSAAVHIIAWEDLDPDVRYGGPIPLGAGSILRSVDIQQRAASLKKSFLHPLGDDNSPIPRHVQQTMRILRFPNGFLEIRYPTRAEFNEGLDLPSP